MTRFPPIGDYAFLSNCEQSCLIAPDGAVEWLCLPRPDSPSVFGALLDRTAGSFRFGPADAQVPQNRRYVPGTMVLETTWQTPTGWLTVHDLLVMGPARRDQRRADYYRAPADTGAVGVLLRLATCIGGRVEVLVNCVPRFNYGTTGGQWSYRGDGYESMSVTPRDGGLPLDIAGNIQLGVLGPRCYGRTTITEGQAAFVSLSWGEPGVPGSHEEAFGVLHRTIGFWRDWLSTARVPDHPWRIYIDRSALTLKGLSYAPTGAIMAAATTSLPETPGGARNWDYRYTWIRDSSFMLRSLYRLGFDWEAVEYFAFILDAVTGGDLSRPEVLDKGVSDRGVFRQHYDNSELDASLLLLPIVGFLPPDDERVKATVLAIANELTRDDLVLRYRVSETDTGFEGDEGTFTICSFWLVTALALIGETERAHALCQKLLSFAGPLLLYAEEIDTATGQHLGNFPQAFTHLALIEAVSLLISLEAQEHGRAFAI